MTRPRKWLVLLSIVSLPAASSGLCLAEDESSAARPVLLSRQLIEAQGLAVGDLVFLAPEASGAGGRSFRVAGVYEPVPDPFRLTSTRLEARLHLPDLIELTRDKQDPASTEIVTRVNVALHDPQDARQFARDLAATMPGLQVLSASRPPAGTDPFVVLDRFHTAIAAVTVLGSAAFLLALMVMRSEERRHTAGILRLLGFRRPRVLLEIFIEALIVALAGAVAGILIAVALQGLFNRFFQWHYDTALVFIRVTPAIALKCVAISVPLGVLAGVVASWTLLRRNILALLRR